MAGYELRIYSSADSQFQKLPYHIWSSCSLAAHLLFTEFKERERESANYWSQPRHQGHRQVVKK